MMKNDAFIVFLIWSDHSTHQVSYKITPVPSSPVHTLNQFDDIIIHVHYSNFWSFQIIWFELNAAVLLCHCRGKRSHAVYRSNIIHDNLFVKCSPCSFLVWCLIVFILYDPSKSVCKVFSMFFSGLMFNSENCDILYHVTCERHLVTSLLT